MKKMMTLVAGLVLGVTVAQAAVQVGNAAPDFSLPSSDGKTVTLAQYKGSFVVLEWYNTGCPFIRKHYDSGNMQALQERYTKQGVVWLSVASSAVGKEGYLNATDAQADRVKNKSNNTATLLDPAGKVGKLYGAKTTPNMFIVDPKGVLIYQGAIDDKPSTDTADVPGAKNYIAQALTEAMAGKPVSEPNTKPYGCSVKY